MHSPNRMVIALEARLKNCRNVRVIGVKSNFCDYSDEDINTINTAERIYYPTSFYSELFNALGYKTFPSYQTYICAQDKIKQTTLFNLLRIPHPRTRFYYGKRQKSQITNHFKFPFIAKIPRGSAMGRGVFLIENQLQLTNYINTNKVAYIQEYIPVDRDIRVVVIGKKIVHAYWRIAGKNDFRSNISQGGRVSLADVPKKALELALVTAHKCGWDDVGIDIFSDNDQFWVIEGNMKYGKEGFRAAGINYIHLMESLIEKREI